jgi:hypothetical protein
MNISPFLSISQSCDKALQLVKKQLLQAELRPIQTFDLHTARLAMHDCPCPNHGTDECDCQLVVLLVYGKDTGPAALVLHGNNGQTWLSLSAESADKKLNTLIQQALEIKTPVSV